MHNSSKVLQLIDSIAATASKNEKQAMVTTLATGSDLFIRVCEYTYNPFKTYGVRQFPVGKVHHGFREFDDGTWGILDDLIARRLTGGNASSAIAGEIDALNGGSAELFRRIIRKDLRAGFSGSTINKAVKGLIPEFPYMRCSLPKDADLSKWPWEKGVLSQEKADGMFANIDHEVGGLVSIRTRQGNEFPMGKFKDVAEEIRTRLAPGHQQHGEFLVLREGVVCARQDGNGVMNHVLSGGDFALTEKPVFMIWDQIPMSAVKLKGKYEIPYAHRFAKLVQQLKSVPGDSLRVIPTRIVKSLAEAKLHAVEFMKAGKEGSVIKHPLAIWKDSTSKDQVKIKLEFEVDLEIIDIVDGRAGTKNEGRPGSFACHSGDAKLRVDVTVKNDAMRNDVEKNPEKWVGRIITVVANDVLLPSESNPRHSLFLPRMAESGYRTDKSAADDLERIFAQKEAAIYGEALLNEGEAHKADIHTRT